jgi:hypothetical protein
VTYTVDNTNPAVSITAPVNGAFYKTANVPAADYTVNELNPYTVYMDGYSTSEGVQTYTVTSTDGAGNSGSASVTYTVDNTLPVVSITAPLDGAYYKTAAVPAGAFSVVEINPHTEVEAGWSNVEGVQTYTVTSTDGAGNSGSASVTYTVEETREQANKVVEEVPANQVGYVVDASDLAGTTVTLDTVAPVTVTILWYEDNPHPDDPLPATALPRYADVMVSDPDAVVWPIYVEMTYTDEEAEGLVKSSLGIYYWMDGAWYRCSNTGVDAERNVVWAYMTREETSGSPILPGGTPLKPAEFILSDLTITPAEVEPGKEITNSVKVTNVGDLEGTHTVDLLVNGVKEQSKTVTLAGGVSTKVSFSVTKSTAGSYAVKVGALTGSFTAVKPLTPAAFTFSGLVVSPAEVAPGAEVTVSVTVKNTGEQSGTYSAELKLDGTTKETKTGTLAGGDSATVTFKVSSQAEGTHAVQVGTQTGSFKVNVPGIPPGYIAGALMILIAGPAFAYVLFKRRRREPETI